MAYLNRKTFDIVNTINPSARPGDWFHVDDVLADTIQILNTRGYITTASKSGQVYCSTRETTIYNVRDTSGKQPELLQIANEFKHRIPSSNILRIERIAQSDYRVVTREYSKAMTSITFSKEYYFRKLPEDTIYENNKLIHFYPDNLTGFDLIAAQVEYCNHLLAWSCDLPLNIFVNDY